MGEFCTVTPNGNNFVFANTKSSTSVARTAIDQRTSVVLGVDGLIIGLPNIPEMGYDMPQVVCFELACPNCYSDFGITRRVTLKTGGKARCGRCTREYDLNNQGMIASDTTGISLYRYRVSYNQLSNTLVVSNR